MAENFDFEPVPVTLQSQYSASPNIAGLTALFEVLLPNADIETFYKNIFNIDTAKGTGLDIWGRIIGVGREIQAEPSDFFGFDGSGLNGFGNDAFYNVALTNTFLMPDDAYRQYLLLTKAFANISDASAPSANYILSQIFKGKKAYVLPADIMKIRFVFEFSMSDLERSIFNLGLLPGGAGVGYEYYEIDTEHTFGFDGSGLESFDNGNFDSYGIRQTGV